METFLILTATISFIVSALLYYFLKSSPRSAVISLAGPVALLFAYLYFANDEFGYWALALAFGVPICALGSASGVYIASALKKKENL